MFVLDEDFFSRYLSILVEMGDLVPITFTRSMLAPTHFLFADDVLLFVRSSSTNLSTIMDAFSLYGSLSRQIVNWEKLFIYFGKRVPTDRIIGLLEASHMRRGGLLSLIWGFLFF